jgi:hypothetical protein
LHAWADVVDAELLDCWLPWFPSFWLDDGCWMLLNWGVSLDTCWSTAF